jgi:hypothetical protein
VSFDNVLYKSYHLVILVDGRIRWSSKSEEPVWIATSGKDVGKAVMEVDGYYYWEPPRATGGVWGAGTLHAIANALDELNKDWDKQVREELESNE